jgi:CheY-like chemotaxis protein
MNYGGKMKSTSSEAKAGSKPVSATESRKQVLCVDSDENTCTVMATLLEELGYDVTHTTTIAEGLNLARRRAFDLLLLDWQLKDGTGVELCQMIRTFNTEIPILFYSVKANDSDAKDALSAGAQGCLAKPVEVVNLLQTISHYAAANDNERQKADN